MNAIRLTGNVDGSFRLSAQVPESIPPGPVTILLLPPAREEEEADMWTSAVAWEWEEDLSDTEQDIYTLADGEPVHET